MWTCDQCGTRHDRNMNAAKNIRNEAQRMIAAGIAGTAYGGSVRKGRDGSPRFLLGPLKEAPSFRAWANVVALVARNYVHNHHKHYC
jgi:putative transposase